MPIRPEFRQFYGREWRETIRPSILSRAGNCCEQCAKPDGARVWVYRSPSCGQYWASKLLPVPLQEWFCCLLAGPRRLFLLTHAQIRWYRANKRLRQIRVVLTVAHLNHDPRDNRDENLKALCQWCHLNYDKMHHRDTRRARKDAARPLLALSAEGARAGKEG